MKCPHCGTKTPAHFAFISNHSDSGYYACLNCHLTTEHKKHFDMRPVYVPFIKFTTRQFAEHIPIREIKDICVDDSEEINEEYSRMLKTEEIIEMPKFGKGIKYDKEKLDWTLLPWRALKEVVKVLMFGAEKYERDNWQQVKPEERYEQAAYRHLIAYTLEEKNDEESGLNHLAHAICCLLFKLWFDITGV